jgi:hypothetical protein
LPITSSQKIIFCQLATVSFEQLDAVAGHFSSMRQDSIENATVSETTKMRVPRFSAVTNARISFTTTVFESSPLGGLLVFSTALHHIQI